MTMVKCFEDVSENELMEMVGGFFDDVAKEYVNGYLKESTGKTLDEHANDAGKATAQPLRPVAEAIRSVGKQLAANREAAIRNPVDLSKSLTPGS